MPPEPRRTESAASDVLVAALSYAARGLQSFPVNGKVPLTPRGLKDATIDPARLTELFASRPAAGVAIRTGRESGIAVLDIDVEHGGAGTLAQLERQYGKLPKTFEVLTGGGGKHLYFRHPGREVRNSAGKLGPGLDVRGDGGYCVAAPSVHANGRPYKLLHDRKFAELPSWLLELLETERAPRQAPKVQSVIPTGRRNHELTSIAGTLRHRGLGSDEILATLREVNRQRCSSSLGDAELAQISASIGSYEPEQELGRRPYTGGPSTLGETVAVFTRWLHLPDVEPVYATLGAAAANYLPGTPVWLVLVGPPASGKTELLHSLGQLPDVYPAATLTEASLLSGSPKREHASGAKGGLLRELGEFGLIVLKDMGSILSMRPDAKAEILAALREVFDGSWTRYVGSDGGRALSWSGKVGLLAGVTPTIDRHHAVLAAMGERFTLCRLGESGEEQAARALAHAGEQEDTMRQELSTAVAALFAGRSNTPDPLDNNGQRKLVRLAGLVTRARSAVERDRMSREIEHVPGAEGPARLAITLERLLAGLDTLGCDRDYAWQVIRRVALDCIPSLRRRLLEQLHEHGPPVPVKTLAESVGLSTNTVRRALEDLTVYGLTTRSGQGKADLWAATDWTRERMGSHE